MNRAARSDPRLTFWHEGRLQTAGLEPKREAALKAVPLAGLEPKRETALNIIYAVSNDPKLTLWHEDRLQTAGLEPKREAALKIVPLAAIPSLRCGVRTGSRQEVWSQNGKPL